jgi:hypothetical protein
MPGSLGRRPKMCDNCSMIPFRSKVRSEARDIRVSLDRVRSVIYANALIRKDEQWFVKENLVNSRYQYLSSTRRAGIPLPPSWEDARRVAVPFISQATQAWLQRIRTIHNR